MVAGNITTQPKQGRYAVSMSSLSISVGYGHSPQVIKLTTLTVLLFCVRFV
jgi:hypothetical protein